MYPESNIVRSKRLQRRWIIAISFIVLAIFAVTLSLLLKFVILKPAKPKTSVTTTTSTSTTTIQHSRTL
jgi:hypothetical protein